ncbi:chromate transporter [Megasphaera hutchinsoni]|jgi:hypothetical protein|uniref:Chromate transporter n=1 Tax=Megasphaera hutchinsoni TaxID=1588748 RepID=A0A2J8BC60_9FIRM|nr:chromate transporter [Megasphaera genomosp. type_2]PNH22364.1 chromate transporter [Megasphaera genomosp. type_2]
MSATPKRNKHFYWLLFKSTFIISAITVGGGFVILPLLKAKFVDEFKWIQEEEALDMVAIAQSIPGVIAANAAILLGYRMARIRGAIIALLATVLPCLITLTIVFYCYHSIISNIYIEMILKGMQCGATILIGKVALALLYKQWKKRYLLPLGILIATFMAGIFHLLPLMLLLFIDGIIGFLVLQDAKYN